MNGILNVFKPWPDLGSERQRFCTWGNITNDAHVREHLFIFHENTYHLSHRHIDGGQSNLHGHECGGIDDYYGGGQIGEANL